MSDEQSGKGDGAGRGGELHQHVEGCARAGHGAGRAGGGQPELVEGRGPWTDFARGSGVAGERRKNRLAPKKWVSGLVDSWAALRFGDREVFG